MLTRRVRIQVAIFVVISVLGIAYTGIRYVGLGGLVGLDGYRVTVNVTETGGIFPDAAVGYRGVSVGTVEDLRLTPDGTAVELRIDETAPPIPADARAVITNRSVIGEQYVDLRPNTADGPYLVEGSVIAAARTSTPPQVEEVLVDLNRTLADVPRDSLRTVVDELGTATRGTGPALASYLESGDKFLDTAIAHLPETKDLIAKSSTVLRTELDQADNLRTFAKGMRGLAGQLRRSDPDLRSILAEGPGAAGELDRLIRGFGPGLSTLTANLLTTSDVVLHRLDGVEQILVSYPQLMGVAPTVLPGDGTAHLGFITNSFDPMACTKGYEGTKLRPGSDTTTQRYNADAYCAEVPGSPTSVRGAQNTPRGGGG